MTSEKTSRGLPFWPFFVVDALLLGVATVIYMLSHQPLLLWEAVLIVICVLGAAWSFLFPFLRKNSDNQAMAQTESLASSMAQINKLEQVSTQISNATAQWQSVQGYATQVADVSKELASSMSREAKAFAEFMQKANDSEKAHLRLEVEKLRRSEVEWVQVLTRILDHIFALMTGARQSGQQNVIEQIGQFQSVCLDIARRVGLTPVIPAAGDPFDSRLHQSAEEGKTPDAEGLIKGTLVSGYSYQGQLIRRAIVAVEAKADVANG